jgi:Domain of unknown function (DUF1707)
MPTPSSPPPTQGPSSGSRASYANPGMRVSDAERAEVADRLSKHYGDGRLDQEEFSKRLDQAMSAVTQADLAGLFADLPEADEPRAEPPRTGRPGTAPPGAEARVAPPQAVVRQRRPRRPLHRVVALALVIVIAAVIGHAMAQLLFPWVFIAILALLWLRYGPGRRHGG